MSNIDEQKLGILLQDPEQRREAFRTVVETCSQQLYGQIRRLVISHEDADDVLQNTFVKAWENIEYFRGEAKVSTWLYRIALNESISFLNRKQNNCQVSLDDADKNIISQLQDDPYFDGDLLQMKLQAAINTLPQKQRIVFNLKYFEEMKYDEISEIVGTSIGSLKASYHHAVSKIMDYFKKHD